MSRLALIPLLGAWICAAHLQHPAGYGACAIMTVITVYHLLSEKGKHHD